MCAAICRSSSQIDVEFLPKGLHDGPSEEMRTRIQESVDLADDGGYEAVLLGYGLCGTGLVGLKARSVSLVIPRAHDCITLFLGSRGRYARQFRQHPGTYFKTTGWIERGSDLDQLEPGSLLRQSGVGVSYEELVKKYGEENARYLYEQLGDYTRNYSRLVFIEMGIERDHRYESMTREEALERGMEFEKIPGDMALIQGLLDGGWSDEDYLVVPPSQAVKNTNDERIIKIDS